MSNAYHSINSKQRKKKRMFDTKMNWLTKSDIEFFKQENYQDSEDYEEQEPMQQINFVTEYSQGSGPLTREITFNNDTLISLGQKPTITS